MQYIPSSAIGQGFDCRYTKHMKSLAVLFGGRLTAYAFEPVLQGRSAFSLCLEKYRNLQNLDKIVLLLDETTEIPDQDRDTTIIRAPEWNLRLLLETLNHEASGYDLLYYGWADTPFIDTDLCAKLVQRHMRYGAEYSYADGWPYGFAPELLYPDSVRVLAALLDQDEQAVERDSIFSVLQKDINAFDIETELSPVDLRKYRVSLSADTKRNLLLMQRLHEAGLASAESGTTLLQQHPELLRTLPAFYQIQVSGPCPQTCSFCPYPVFGAKDGSPITARKDFMSPEDFSRILDKICSFSGDAVIDLSLWGEASLHPDIEALVQAVLSRDSLSLVLESSGIGWDAPMLDRIAKILSNSKKRNGGLARLSWIISLDSDSPERYRKIRGEGFEQAKQCVALLAERFPGAVYVQALRIRDEEDDLEQFYRNWKEKDVQIIVQKYDHFCGYLPDLKAGDLSPIQRNPCWHLMRDISILVDGTVPLCREDVEAERILGNVFSDDLEKIWAQGMVYYKEQCAGTYSGICAGCDEYYTYNF